MNKESESESEITLALEQNLMKTHQPACNTHKLGVCLCLADCADIMASVTEASQNSLAGNMWDYYAELVPLTTIANNSQCKHCLSKRNYRGIRARQPMAQAAIINGAMIQGLRCDTAQLVHEYAAPVDNLTCKRSSLCSS